MLPMTSHLRWADAPFSPPWQVFSANSLSPHPIQSGGSVSCDQATVRRSEDPAAGISQEPLQDQCAGRGDQSVSRSWPSTGWSVNTETICLLGLTSDPKIWGTTRNQLSRGCFQSQFDARRKSANVWQHEAATTGLV